MTKLKQLWLLTALGSVVALAGGYFLVVSPKLGKAEALRAETETELSANQSLRSQIQMLNRQKKELPRQQAELQRFAAKVPNNPALPAVIRSVSDAADNAGAELIALNPGAPAPVTLNLAKANGAVAPQTAATAATPQIGLAAIPVVIRVTGTYSELSQFLSEVERLPRALLVNVLTVTPEDLGPKVKKEGAAVPKDDIYTGILTLELSGQLYMTTKPPAVRPQPAPTTVVD